jgi:glycerol-3-phosphate dehydrogenase (NAD(P)+)
MTSALPERIAVVGTTSWGTTLAVLLARNGHDVILWCRSDQEAATLAAARENKRQRPGLKLPDSLRVSAAAEGLAQATTIVLAVPSQTLPANLERVLAHSSADATLISAIKGLDPATGRRVSETIAERGVEGERILVLSGPNFATEIAAGLPAASVIAGRDAGRAERAQALLNSPTFRVYTSADVTGVELGGALKNVIAIACGISDGLGYGENAKAALITRGLAEIARLGVACGASPLTFLGLAGLGDLVLTCESDLSRNRRLGLALGEGKTLEEAGASIDGVVEGVVTVRAVRPLSQRAGVEMPISSALHAVLYEGLPPREAVRELMSRAAKPELEGFAAV